MDSNWSIKLNVFPKLIRVSVGSAIVLRLLKGKLDALPTTAYLMTYKDGKCTANCGFCPQARASRSRDGLLSRVSWPIFETRLTLERIVASAKDGDLKRVCIQSLNYPSVFSDIQQLTEAIHEAVSIPISVSCQPPTLKEARLLFEAGAERIGIPLDSANKGIFDKVKGRYARGPYRWKRQFELLRAAVDVFGKERVSTHLIVGLGESEKDLVTIIQWCVDTGVLPALFAFTPVTGTALENLTQPSVRKYRRIQLARHIIITRGARCENMKFDPEGQIIDFGVTRSFLEQIAATGNPFRTSGCPACNRPFYNEKPSGPIYNYPEPLTQEEIEKVAKEYL